MEIKTPVLVINLKTYQESLGKNAITLAKAAESVAHHSATSSNVVLAAQATDIYMLSQHTKLPIFAQHIDAVEEGNRTGSITPQAAKEAGAIGTLINHSEKRIPEAQIEKTVELCKKHGLMTIICAESPEEAKKLAKFNPDFIAIEPPELIGGKVSVSDAKPEVITGTVELIPNHKVLCGAGVQNKHDAEVAAKLGSKGLLVASGIVKAKDPAHIIKEMLDGLKEGSK